MVLNLIKIKPQLFICYARQDAEMARSINAFLLNEGYTSFFDTKRIFGRRCISKPTSTPVHGILFGAL